MARLKDAGQCGFETYEDADMELCQIGKHYRLKNCHDSIVRLIHWLQLISPPEHSLLLGSDAVKGKSIRNLNVPVLQDYMFKAQNPRKK